MKAFLKRNIGAIITILFTFINFSDLDLQLTNKIKRVVTELNKPSPYKTLQVAPWYSWKKIKKHYLKLSAENHPDKNLNSNNTMYYTEIQEAYEILQKSINKNSEDEDILLTLIYIIGWNTFKSFVSHITLRFLSYYLFKFVDLTYEFLIIWSFVDQINLHLLQHHYPSMLSNLFTTLILSILINYYIKTIKKFCNIKTKFSEEANFKSR